MSVLIVFGHLIIYQKIRRWARQILYWGKTRDTLTKLKGAVWKSRSTKFLSLWTLIIINSKILIFLRLPLAWITCKRLKCLERANNSKKTRQCECALYWVRKINLGPFVWIKYFLLTTRFFINRYYKIGRVRRNPVKSRVVSFPPSSSYSS